MPSFNQMPGSHKNLKGVTNYRGTSIPIIDMRQAIKMKPVKHNDQNAEQSSNVIITEYNRTVQGFLIGDVLNIVNTSWSDIQPPPNSIGKANYLTAITQVEIDGKNELVEIIDVEKVLAEIIDYHIKISEEVLDDAVLEHLKGKKILIVDDSATARQQTRDTLSQLGIEIIEEKDGLRALNLLRKWLDEGMDVEKDLLMMITDAEMPEMDGYMLTAEVRSDPRMKDLYVTLNTSLSGRFNEAMVEKVGCDKFISKFQPDLLVDVVQERMRSLLEKRS